MNKDKAKLSVVIPVYNRAHLLGRCLNAVLNIKLRPLDIIIVDNNSSDDSLGVAERWAEMHNHDSHFRVRVLEEKRPGAARARQTGLEIVDTDWVFFADSDDEVDSDIFSMALHNADGVDMFYWPIAKVSGKRRLRPIVRFTEKDLMRRQTFNSIFTTQAMMVRTDFIKDAGGWRSESRVWDDWDLGIRLLLRNPRIKGINHIGAFIYPQAESITGLDFSSKAGEWEKVMDYVYSFGGWLCGAVDYRRIILAAHYYREGKKELAAALKNKTLRESCEPLWRKELLKLIYWYTAFGGRGAYKLWR